ncbi:MAG: S1C family serine protease [Bacteroidia bacterium]|nr:S1C family serine protease [Bacteroidia bacterium]
MNIQDELFDRYLNGQLGTEEKQLLEARLQSDLAFRSRFEEHLLVLKVFRDFQAEQHFRQTLNQIEQKFHSGIVPLKSSGRKSGMAQAGLFLKVAAVAALTSCAVLFLGWKFFFKSHNPNHEITNLKLQIHGLKYFQKALQSKINEKFGRNNLPEIPVFQGTGFILNNEGYILTGCHIVQNADSIYVSGQNISLQRSELISKDSLLDLALIKIPKESVHEKVNISILEGSSSLGEKIFTLGYPGIEQVYGEGVLSALNGFDGDTSLYQISLPLNPGNSGGPLWDQSGNIIGIIRGKNFAREGNAFAVKSKYVAEFLKKAGVKGVRFVKSPERTINLKHFIKKNAFYVVQIHAWQKQRID